LAFVQENGENSIPVFDFSEPSLTGCHDNRSLVNTGPPEQRI